MYRICDLYAIKVLLIYSILLGCVNLRLGHGGCSGSYERLECQLQDGTWGTVCGSGFGINAAKAACRQLGYPGRASYAIA